MLPVKRISIAFLICFASYGVLIAPWPGVMNAYRACFRGAGSFLFDSVGTGGSATFEPLSQDDHTLDTKIVLGHTRIPGATPSIRINCASIGYRPTVFLLALVLATPIPWSRKWRALLWGLFWVNVFVGFRVWLVLFNAFSGDDPLNAFSLSPFWKSALGWAVLGLVRDATMHYVAPAFIWLLVTFRRGDLRSLLSERSRPIPEERQAEA